ncbi:FAD-dependent oxidoreductase [Natronobacterium gregoryi]|uniref:Flavodoxin reductase family protein n=2 Tax=Natronobacterium gregoryi TaxID=44930 RepID=L0AM45_NATGS|nr:FAD-dependent oxidoreductase [Natronobacterium gregoryi]AFZ74252.1 flavodoxin reductase family protein [Natronobacterium gregoryi SP2]ELY63710.1 Oxidoreductase FAD-binding domain-containing protein [Natronobacterium gregoryi SP2]PLK21964.1 oxidoreductase [Natronobacterium gregoryi SP2]SFI52378.1 Ferredoxin-NADP reductase [Natronobacterium gregoryi]
MEITGTPVTVESVRDVGPSTIALELETPAAFDALPGQFVLLRAAPEDEVIERHYTLSSPSTEGTFELTVGVDPDGELSPWLAELDGGETVHVDGPFGQITYERDRDVVAVAGGPGVGPAVSIAEAAHDAGHEAVVVYQDDDPAHEQRLETLEDEGATVVLADENDDGTIADAIETHLKDGQCYAFGFEAFVTAVSDAIEDAGGDPDDALIENFG